MTDVPWATKHWRVVAGCTKKSRGCAHCFAARLAATRLKRHPAYEGLAEIRRNAGGMGKNQLRWSGEVRCFPDQLTEPLRRRKPLTYFVGEMGDIVHSKVPFDFLAQVFAVMAVCAMHDYFKGHQFLLLTKRPERLAEFYGWPERKAEMAKAAGALMQDGDAWHDSVYYHLPWPLANVWPGISAEGQSELDERAPTLLRIPVHEQAGHWLSLEPQLEHVEVNFAKGHCPTHDGPGFFCHGGCPDDRNFRAVIQGCESGPNRRPFDIEWAISMHQQCQEAGVDYYLKQMPSRCNASGRAVSGGKIDKEPQLYGRTWRKLPWAK